MSVACTFSGKYGDILWSLPTAREIALRHRESVHFYVMEEYASICSLLAAQPYIASAQPLIGWKAEHYGWGAQPWEHGPLQCVGEPDQYDKVYDLTYRCHPTDKDTLIDFIAKQQGIRLGTLGAPVPFLYADMPPASRPADLVFSFPEGNEIDFGRVHTPVEVEFWDLIAKLSQKLRRTIILGDVRTKPWLEAARAINSAKLFVGSHSALCVIAHGLGKPVYSIEPEEWRKAPLYGCPYGRTVDFDGVVQALTS